MEDNLFDKEEVNLMIGIINPEKSGEKLVRMDLLPQNLDSLSTNVYNQTLNSLVDTSTRKRGRPRKYSKEDEKPEEMNKFWLRAFRKYMRGKKANLIDSEDQEFYDWYLSDEGIPEKTSRKYKSYNSRYIDKLFRNESFSSNFKEFFDSFASRLMTQNKKLRNNRIIADKYYKHGRNELYRYELSKSKPELKIEYENPKIDHSNLDLLEEAESLIFENNCDFKFPDQI